MNYKSILSPMLFLVVVSVVFSSCDPLFGKRPDYSYDCKTGVFTSLIWSNGEEYRQMDMDYKYLKKGSIHKFKLSHGAGEPITIIRLIDERKVSFFWKAMEKSHLVRLPLPRPRIDIIDLSEYHW